MSELRVSDILNNAATLIEERGWTQGRSEDSEGRLCLVGAVCRYRITGPFSLYDDVFRALHRWVYTGDLADWNDAPKRTAAEVIFALRGVASIEKAAGR